MVPLPGWGRTWPHERGGSLIIIKLEGTQIPLAHYQWMCSKKFCTTEHGSPVWRTIQPNSHGIMGRETQSSVHKPDWLQILLWCWLRHLETSETEEQMLHLRWTCITSAKGIH
jgi:hypothetical protein